MQKAAEWQHNHWEQATDGKKTTFQKDATAPFKIDFYADILMIIT